MASNKNENKSTKSSKTSNNLNDEVMATSKKSRRPVQTQMIIAPEIIEAAKSKVVVAPKIIKKQNAVCSVSGCLKGFQDKTQLNKHVRLTHPELWAETHPIVTKAPVVQREEWDIVTKEDGSTFVGAVLDGSPMEADGQMAAALADALSPKIINDAREEVIAMIEAPVVEVVAESEPVMVLAEVTPMAVEEKPESIEEKLAGIDAIEQNVLHQIRGLAQAWLDDYTVVLRNWDKSRKEYDAHAGKLAFLKNMIVGFPQFQPQYAEAEAKLASAYADLSYWKSQLEEQQKSSQADVVRMYNLHPTSFEKKAVEAPKQTAIKQEAPKLSHNPSVKGDVAKLINGTYEYFYKGQKTNSQKGAISYVTPLLREKDAETVAGKLIRNVLSDICDQLGLEFSEAEGKEWASKMIEAAQRKLTPVVSK